MRSKGAGAWNSQYIKDAFKDHVHRYERLGTYTSPDNDKLDVLIVLPDHENVKAGACSHGYSKFRCGPPQDAGREGRCPGRVCVAYREAVAILLCEDGLCQRHE